MQALSSPHYLFEVDRALLRDARLFEKTLIEGARQKFARSHFFNVAAQVGEHNRRIAAELPNDLATGAARRC
jgi:hypothetical protein